MSTSTELGLKNYMEDIVLNKMPAILSNMKGICECERCHMDRLAYVLNNTPPKYIVTPNGKLYAKLSALEGQFDVDIARIVTEAAVRVDECPRHDEEDM